MVKEESCILIQNVSKRFGAVDVLKNIQLEIKKGEIFGLLGPSGAGKSTLVKELVGLDSPTIGEYFLFNEKMPSLKLIKKIGYMAQTDGLYEDLTAKENLLFFAKLYGLKGKQQMVRINKVMQMVDLTDHLQKVVRHYSGGMKRRLSLAIALLHEPEVLILDEPTVGIDPVLRQSIWNAFHALNKNGTTIIVTTHVMDEAEKCHRLGLMRDGALIAVGTPQQLKKETDSIEGAFLVYGGGRHEN